jgi:hypothetical protein
VGAVLGLAAVLGCGTRGEAGEDGGTLTGFGTGSAGSDSAGDDSGDSGGVPETGGDDTGGSDGPKLDVGFETGGPEEACVPTVDPDPGQVTDCDEQAPPGSFDPDVQWTWDGEGGIAQVIVTPLVANLTDDDDNGIIDLCDTPDVVVTAYYSQSYQSPVGSIAVLDGATGQTHFQISTPVMAMTNAALGDIDGDGVIEIVTAELVDGLEGRLVAFEHDGTLKWQGDTVAHMAQRAVALADLDADGDVEIILDGLVADHEGHTLWHVPMQWQLASTAVVDLDGDHDLEIVLATGVHDHEGNALWSIDGFGASPVVADLDGDGDPEVGYVAADRRPAADVRGQRRDDRCTRVHRGRNATRARNRGWLGRRSPILAGGCGRAAPTHRKARCHGRDQRGGRQQHPPRARRRRVSRLRARRSLRATHLRQRGGCESRRRCSRSATSSPTSGSVLRASPDSKVSSRRRRMSRSGATRPPPSSSCRRRS